MPPAVTGRRRQRLLPGAGGAASAQQAVSQAGHSQARRVSPDPATKAAPAVSSAGVSPPQHCGRGFQAWPRAGLSCALEGGSRIPGPCPHEASSSAQLRPPRGLLDMAECPLGGKAAWVESPRAAPATLQVELSATWCISPILQIPCDPECRAQPGRITPDKAVTVGRVRLGTDLVRATGRRGRAPGGAEGTEVAQDGGHTAS